MNQSHFENWLRKLGKAWSERDPDAAASLFSKDCKYYESVFDKPCKGWDDILKLWQEVPKNQKSITFSSEIIVFSGNICVANWLVTRTMTPSNEKQIIDGIFQITLNNQGLCSYFKQWRNVKKV